MGSNGSEGPGQSACDYQPMKKQRLQLRQAFSGNL